MKIIKIFCIFPTSIWVLVTMAMPCEQPFSDSKHLVKVNPSYKQEKNPISEQTRKLITFAKEDSDLNNKMIIEYSGRSGQIQFANKYFGGNKIYAFKIMESLVSPDVFDQMKWIHPDTWEQLVRTPGRKTLVEPLVEEESENVIGEQISKIILNVSEGQTIAPPSLTTIQYAKFLKTKKGLRYKDEEGFNQFAQEHFYGDPQQAIKHLLSVLEPKRWKELGWKTIRDLYINQNSFSATESNLIKIK